MSETLRGEHVFRKDFTPGGVSQGATHPLEFSVRWGNQHLARFLDPRTREFFQTEMSGTITAGGICRDAPLEGTLALDYFKDARIRYDFEFAAQGRQFRYHGEKRDIRPWNLHRTHTQCFGTITESDSGELLSESVVYFDLRQLPRFLASFRLK